MSGQEWGSDSSISRPVANPNHARTEYVDLGGMIFTPQGISLPATDAMIESRYLPQWTPVRPPRDRVDGEDRSDG